jgi:hypothetical protein
MAIQVGALRLAVFDGKQFGGRTSASPEGGNQSMDTRGCNRTWPIGGPTVACDGQRSSHDSVCRVHAAFRRRPHFGRRVPRHGFECARHSRSEKMGRGATSHGECDRLLRMLPFRILPEHSTGFRGPARHGLCAFARTRDAEQLRDRLARKRLSCRKRAPVTRFIDSGTGFQAHQKSRFING